MVDTPGKEDQPFFPLHELLYVLHNLANFKTFEKADLKKSISSFSMTNSYKSQVFTLGPHKTT